ncbi:MAG TPA: GGDEF domain-containing protein [Afipia sp.]
MKKAGNTTLSRRPAAKKPSRRSTATEGKQPVRVKAPARPASSKAEPAGSEIAKAGRQIAALRAELAAARDRIDELQAWADTDFLLNIYNRRGFERELDRAMAYMRRYKATGALIVLDVDRLKPINDVFGHAAGDVVLKSVVAVLMRHIRSSDVVGRLGGDEFGLLLWNLTEADALAKAEVLEDAIDRLTFVFKGRSVVAGGSAGVAWLSQPGSVAEAMENADRAMYARKASRRSRAREAF